MRASKQHAVSIPFPKSKNSRSRLPVELPPDLISLHDTMRFKADGKMQGAVLVWILALVLGLFVGYSTNTATAMFVTAPLNIWAVAYFWRGMQYFNQASTIYTNFYCAREAMRQSSSLSSTYTPSA